MHILPLLLLSTTLVQPALATPTSHRPPRPDPALDTIVLHPSTSQSIAQKTRGAKFPFPQSDQVRAQQPQNVFSERKLHDGEGEYRPFDRSSELVTGMGMPLQKRDTGAVAPGAKRSWIGISEDHADAHPHNYDGPKTNHKGPSARKIRRRKSASYYAYDRPNSASHASIRTYPSDLRPRLSREVLTLAADLWASWAALGVLVVLLGVGVGVARGTVRVAKRLYGRFWGRGREREKVR